MQKKIVKLVAAIVLSYFVVTAVLLIFVPMLEKGSVSALSVLIDGLPFGDFWFQLSKNIIGIFAEVNSDSANAVREAPTLTLISFLKDISALILTSLCFDPLMEVVLIASNEKDKKGLLSLLIQGVLGITVSLVCSVICMVVTNSYISQLERLPIFAQGIMSGVLSGVLMLGGFLVAFFFLGQRILEGLLFFAGHFLMANMFKVVIGYLGVFGIIHLLQSGISVDITPVIMLWVGASILVTVLDGLLSQLLGL